MLSPEVHKKQKFALMEATVRSIADNGMTNTTSRVIGSLSGVNQVYIYSYFENMEDLITKTFDYADQHFLNFLLDNFDVMYLEGVDYQTRCRMLFDKCWGHILTHPDWLKFYVRYYYSQQFIDNSYADHIERYRVLTDKVAPACHPDANVDTVVHHVIDTLLGQARKQVLCPQDGQRAADDTFWLIFSVLKCGKGI